MTQFLCGHPGHSDPIPNLTVQVCSALRAPVLFVGELDVEDTGDGAAVVAASDTATRVRIPRDVEDAIQSGRLPSVMLRAAEAQPLPPGTAPAVNFQRSAGSRIALELPGSFFDIDELDNERCWRVPVEFGTPRDLYVRLGPEQEAIVQDWLDEILAKVPVRSPDLAGVYVAGSSGIVAGSVSVSCEPATTEAFGWPHTILDWLSIPVVVFAVWSLVWTLDRSVDRWPGAVVAGLGLLIAALFKVWSLIADSNQTPWRVVVACPTLVGEKAHRVVFDKPAGERDAWPSYVFGALASESDTTLVASHAGYVDRDKAVDRLNRQAKFVLGGQAFFVLFLGGVVWRVTASDAGAAVGVTDIDQLVRDQPAAYSFAIAALALSFSLALVAQTSGFGGAVNLQDQVATSREFNRVLRWRASLVHNAAILLGVSLLLAVAVPIASANSRGTGVVIAAPTWVLTDGVWNGTSSVELTDLGGDDRLEVAAWTSAGDSTRLLAHWNGVRPSHSSDGDAITVEVDFIADPGSTITIGAVTDGGANTGSTAIFSDIADCRDDPSVAACATFAVPDRPVVVPTLTASWETSGAGELTLTLSTTAAGVAGGQLETLTVAVFRDVGSTVPVEIHRASFTADASGVINRSQAFSLDPRREHVVTASFSGVACTPQDQAPECNLFAVPADVEVTVPVIVLTSIDGPVTGEVSVPRMHYAQHLRVIVWTAVGELEPMVVYETVVGISDSPIRTVSFSAPIMNNVSQVIVDARLSKADETQAEAIGQRDRCHSDPVAAGCLVVRFD